MDLRSLRSFIAVAEEGHFGRAAARLHISQPPLTRQIHALEAELGVALFTRTPRGAVPTEAGEALLRDARALAALAGQAAERARRAGRGEVGRLDLGIYGTAVLDYVPRLLAALAADCPDVQVVLHHAPKAEQIEAVRQGRVLVGFDRNLPVEPDIETHLAFREPVLVALNIHHRLARRARIDLARLAGDPFVIGSGGDEFTTSACAAAGFAPRVAQAVGDVMTGVSLVACGIGVALVPASIANLRLPGVVYRPLADAGATADLAYFHRAGETSPLLARLKGVVAKLR
jgi:DNA-binding transcriptional LysR family regulator